MGRRLAKEGPESSLEMNGLVCGVCGELQYVTSSGATCKNSHGGADGVEPQQATEIKKRYAGSAGEAADGATKQLKENTKKLEQIAETSEKLAKVLTQGDDDDREKRAVEARKRIVFGSANAARKSEMRADFKKMVETIWIENIADTSARLIKELELGELRGDYGSVIKGLDRAETNAREAHGLYVTTVREREAWEKRNDTIFASMRVEATKELQREKDQGQRNKAITDADVTSMAAILFGDEWISQEKERKDYELAEKHIKNLSDRWDSRCKTLATLASKLR